MVEVGSKFVRVISGLLGIFGFGRQVTEAISVVFRCIPFLFDILLSENSVEWIEFKNFFKPGAV